MTTNVRHSSSSRADVSATMSLETFDGKYVMVECIGAGTFGAIYKAENVLKKTPAAIKYAEKAHKDPSELHAIFAEAKVMHYLASASNMYTPNIKWYNACDNYVYFAMDLLDDPLSTFMHAAHSVIHVGEKTDNFTADELASSAWMSSFLERVNHQANIDVECDDDADADKYTLRNIPDLMRKIIIQMIDALEHIHSLGVVHRDVKPDNFVFDDEGRRSIDEAVRLKMIDFGLCKVFSSANDKDDDGEVARGFVGTPIYASVGAHKCAPPLPKHDLESMTYIVFAMTYHRHGLPWEASSPSRILALKQSMLRQMKKHHFDAKWCEPKTIVSHNRADMLRITRAAFSMSAYLQELGDDKGDVIDYSFLRNLFQLPPMR